MGVRYAIQIIGGVIILFAISWKLCLVMLSIVPAIVIGAVVYGKFVRSLSKKVQDALAAVSFKLIFNTNSLPMLLKNRLVI
jgi:ATP-binding cassette subfamily B protein